MSQRALKKREHNLLKQEKETHQIYRKQAQPLNAQQKPTKYTQRTANNSISSVLSKSSAMKPHQIDKSKCSMSASKMKFHSTPNLAAATSSSITSILSTDRRKHNHIFRSRSENDLSCMPDEANVLVNAKSEFHLQSISSTQVPTQGFQSLSTITSDRAFNQTKQNTTVTKPMITQSQNLYAKRIQSGHSSQTAGSMTSSTSTQSGNVGFCDSANIRIPIIGYEVMEERARFTVKIDSLSFHHNLVRNNNFHSFFFIVYRSISYESRTHLQMIVGWCYVGILIFSGSTISWNRHFHTYRRSHCRAKSYSVIISVVYSWVIACRDFNSMSTHWLPMKHIENQSPSEISFAWTIRQRTPIRLKSVAPFLRHKRIRSITWKCNSEPKTKSFCRCNNN